MPGVKIDRFGGIAPRLHPTQLADGMAVRAHNCHFKNGKLVPLRKPSVAFGATLYLENALDSPAGAKSIHVWRTREGDAEFLLFPGVTHVAEGNVADDELTRLVVSGDTGISFGTVENTPVVYMREGAQKTVVPICKTPLPAPKASRVSSAALTEPVRYTRFFWTWVDRFGMESPCSEPSLVEKTDGQTTEWVEDDIEYNDGDVINLASPGLDAKIEEAVKIRIYKVVTGTSEGRVQFISEVNANNDFWDPQSGGVAVRVKDEDAGEVMPEIEAPPADLRSILDVPGGFYCGVSPSAPKTVFFSDVDLLYSWPTAYRYDVKDNVVALAVTANTVFALTDGWPYVLSGTAPESMTVAKLAGPAACVSPRGVCVYKNAVFYVSNAGLMMISNSADAGTVCQNLTEKSFTKEQWESLNPSSCVMGQFDGALELFFALPDGTRKGLTIDLGENASTAIATHSEAAKCLCTDNKTDKLYYVRAGGAA